MLHPFRISKVKPPRSIRLIRVLDDLDFLCSPNFIFKIRQKKHPATRWRKIEDRKDHDQSEQHTDNQARPTHRANALTHPLDASCGELVDAADDLEFAARDVIAEDRRGGFQLLD